MTTDKRALQIPPQVANKADRFEILRVWAAGEEQHLSLASGLWEKPQEWGMVLADIARDIAAALAQSQEKDEEMVLEALLDAFDAEWEE